MQLMRTYNVIKQLEVVEIMGIYKEQGISWIIFSIAAILPTVTSQPVLTSNVEKNCPGSTIIFTCTTNGSSTLIWRSEEYIGLGSQIEFRSIIDPVGTLRTSISNPDTVANLTAISHDRMLNILTSTLRIKAGSATSSVGVSCINTSGGTNTLTIPPAAVPRVPHNVRAAEISQPIDNICVILVTWSPPVNSNGSDIDHYIVYVPSRNIMEIEPLAISILRVLNCRNNDTILVAAVNRFGCVGLNTSAVKPRLSNDSAQTTEESTVTEGENGSTSSTSVTVAAVVGTVLILISVIVLVIAVFFFLQYRRGKKEQVVNDDQKGVTSYLEQTTQETVQELQDYSVYMIKHQLEELYVALKSSNLQIKLKQIKIAAIVLNGSLKSSSKYLQ